MPNTQRRIKWEETDYGYWIVRMNSKSLTIGTEDGGFYVARFAGSSILYGADDLAAAKRFALRWARKQIRAMAREWGVR